LGVTRSVIAKTAFQGISSDRARLPTLARFGHPAASVLSPLSGWKRTSPWQAVSVA